MLPSDLSPEQHGTCIQEFVRGRNHIIFGFIVKNSYLPEAQHCVFALAHPAYKYAYAAYQKCRVAVSTHKRIVDLQREPLKTEADAYFVSPEHKTHADDGFLVWRGELRFAWSNERPVEGDHATFHKRGQAAYGHSVHYLSFARRVVELRKDIAHDPEVVVTLAKVIQDNPTPLCSIRFGVTS